MLSVMQRQIIPLWVAGPVALAAFCLTLLHATSKHLETDEPQVAIALNPFNAQARFQAILDAGLQDKDRGAAQREIETNLVTSVGDARNFSLLGTLRRKEGMVEQAQALFAAALRLNPSEPNAAREQIDLDISARRYDDALRRVDVYTRKGGPGAQDIAGHLVRLALADPNAQAAVMKGLAADPPWRSAFLSELQKTPSSLSLVPRALAILQTSARKPTEPEIAGAVRAFLSAGNPAAAYRLFVTSRDEASRPLISFVYDPEFRAAPSGNPFDWAIANSGAAEVRIPAPGDGGAEIGFLERPGAGFGMSQTLALLPGAYGGALKASAMSVVAPDGVFVYVRCASGRTLAKADIPHGTYNNREIDFRFEVPSTGCDLQTLGFATNQIFQHWSRTYSGTLRIHSARLATINE